MKEVAAREKLIRINRSRLHFDSTVDRNNANFGYYHIFMYSIRLYLQNYD